jgi:hypothetical protein
MSIKLYVDDLRPAPVGWTLARTITQAIRILATQDVSEVSLDHDIVFRRNRRLPDESETFEPVCRYIKLLNTYFEYSFQIQGGITEPPMKVYCHSGNAVAYDKYSDILGYRVIPFACRPEALEKLR